MNILIKSAKIIDTNSEHHNKIMDIFIKKIGKVEGNSFKIINEFEISLKDLITYNKKWFKNFIEINK